MTELVESDRKRARHALPTNEEQRDLNNAEIVMKTNLLQLQVHELLQQVNGVRKLKTKRVDDFLEMLLSDVTERVKDTCHDREVSHEWMKKQSFFGLELVNSEDNLSITYRKPIKAEYLGSYSNESSTIPILNIDIGVLLPNDTFEERYKIHIFRKFVNY